ncbi:hypothetical protein PVL29_005926 [Vitis rotundifolia]|uniref:Preprotein translocase subunit SECE1 n=1 Tax=Vitis rotundifolia TaxID=103349 RepID=A0AA39A3U2_VITRO|nr:hypothetical protein PVL29_005926 [Vitis rotundifolia]
MALHLSSMQFPVSSSSPSTRLGKTTSQLKTSAQIRARAAVISHSVFHRRTICTNAIEQGRQDGSSDEPETIESPPAEPSTAELSELGSEIKKTMKERGETRKEADLWSGVAEEIREIEWPAFGKVLGTTWVVLGVIAGSSVALLTVNAVLAELSDRVFAGKGVQDFFG